jgi:hypothetical protein
MMPPPIHLGKVAAKLSGLREKVELWDPIQSATSFGALCTVAELQSSYVRMEVLIHLLLALAKGRSIPTSVDISGCFVELKNKQPGLYEDPAEDLFVAPINTDRGTFRILTGIWESPHFYLQRAMAVLDRMPTKLPLASIVESSYGLLKLSEITCQRAGYARGQLGSDVPCEKIPGEILQRMPELIERISFSSSDLHELGISQEALRDFIFPMPNIGRLLSQQLSNSSLERAPLVESSTGIVLILPTAVATAIRLHVISRVTTLGLREHFLAALSEEYSKLIFSLPVLGTKYRMNAEFVRMDGLCAATSGFQVDTGRRVGIVFDMDLLEGCERSGMGMVEPSATSGSALQKLVAALLKALQTDATFTGGVLVLVTCGIGRGFVKRLSALPKGWTVVSMSAADFATLSWLKDVSPLTLWRILEAEGDLELRFNIRLMNVNGFLNLVAWSRSLGGGLVPPNLPKGFSDPTRKKLVVVQQNGLREVRSEVAEHWDPHKLQFVDGAWTSVRRTQHSLFAEDAKQPLYFEEDSHLEGRFPRCAFVTSKRIWWAELIVPEDTDQSQAYQRSLVVSLWLSKSANILDQYFPELGSGPLLWRAKFKGPLGRFPENFKKRIYEEVVENIDVSAEPVRRLVSTEAGESFELGIFSEENLSERALVASLITATSQLAGREITNEECKDLLSKIVTSGDAKQAHAFQGMDFRDHMASKLGAIVVIDATDAAQLLLGSAWTAVKPTEELIVLGAVECTTFLNSVVLQLEKNACSYLQAIDRRALVLQALSNHEAAAVDKNLWNRTVRAVLAIHDEKDEARETIRTHEYELNAVFQSTRLVVEAAICECPMEGGRAPGELDLARAMAMMRQIFDLGGLSDAIRWGAVEPHLRVGSLGDITYKRDFVDDVILPFARVASDLGIARAAVAYGKNFSAASRESLQIVDLLEKEFLDAVKEQYGAEIGQLLSIADVLEDIGVRQGTPVLEIEKEALIAEIATGLQISEELTEGILDKITLSSRTTWLTCGEGFREQDRQPWRYRRQLSLLRRPLVQFEMSSNPKIAVAPGLTREAIVRTLENFHLGSFPAYQLTPRMKTWAGRVANARGEAFSREVAKRLEEFGWQCRVGIELTEILGRPLGENFGDVDVLAWNVDTNRVAAVECKDVQFRKTFGEISEQVADFRGIKTPDGRNDLLLKHLRRVEQLRIDPSRVCKFVGLKKTCEVESLLVFRNPVPMKFALVQLASKVRTLTIDEIDRL